jgi:hypothetical protein
MKAKYTGINILKELVMEYFKGIIPEVVYIDRKSTINLIKDN